MSSKNSERTVYLLSQNNAGELMRQGHPAQRKKQVGPLTRGGRPAIRRSDGKDEPLDPFIAEAPQVGGELFRRELPSATVEQNGMRRRAAMLTT